MVRRADQSESTTANCNLFIDVNCHHMFLDFEGENGTEPLGLLRNPMRKICKIRQKRKMDKPKTKDKSSRDSFKEPPLYELEQFDDDDSVRKLTRRAVVAKMLPKLAYMICDVLLFVTTDEIHADYSVYDRCMTFAMRANAFVQDTDRPALIVVHNKYNVSLNALERELDVDISTRQFLETFDPELKLASYFSGFYVIRLPMIGEAYDSPMLRGLWDQQIETLLSVINACKNARSQHRIAMSCQLTQKLWFKFVKGVVEDIVYDKPISTAKHIQKIIHMECKEDTRPLIDLFEKIYEKKPRRTDWYYKCARLTVDTLARLWGLNLREGGYDIEHNKSYGEKLLSKLMEALDQLKPCSATHPTHPDLPCNQTKALHDCHRSDVCHSFPKYKKILNWITKRGTTVTWEGGFVFTECERERDLQLCESFWLAAKAFATNDAKGIQMTMKAVMEHDDYQSCIWETLLLNQKTVDSDQEIRSWAKRLVTDSMRLLNIEDTDNIWEKAVSDWNYLNVLCKQLSRDQVTLKSKISDGAFGEVFLGSYQLSGKEWKRCAVKVIRSDTPFFNVNAVRQEIVVMSLIEERSILRLFGYCQFQERKDQTIYYLVVELMDCSLQQWLDERVEVDILGLLSLASNIADGIQTLHNYNIIHRDIKPANILLDVSQHSVRAVVGDLGLARCAANQQMSMRVGSCGYMAPEVYQADNGSYDHKADVFSFGKVLKEMLSNLLPCRSSDSLELNEHRDILLRLARECCAQDPAARHTMIHVLYRLQELYEHIYTLRKTASTGNETFPLLDSVGVESKESKKKKRRTILKSRRKSKRSKQASEHKQLTLSTSELKLEPLDSNDRASKKRGSKSNPS